MARRWRKILGWIVNVDDIEADYPFLSRSEKPLDLAHDIQDTGGHVVVLFTSPVAIIMIFDFVPAYGRWHDLFVLFATTMGMAVSAVVNEVMMRSMGSLALRVCQTLMIVGAVAATFRAFR